MEDVKERLDNENNFDEAVEVNNLENENNDEENLDKENVTLQIAGNDDYLWKEEKVTDERIYDVFYLK